MYKMTYCRGKAPPLAGRERQSQTQGSLGPFVTGEMLVLPLSTFGFTPPFTVIR